MNDANNKISLKGIKEVEKLHIVDSSYIETEVNPPTEAFNFNPINLYCDIVHEEEKLCFLCVFCEIPCTYIKQGQDTIIKKLKSGGAGWVQGIDTTDL